MTTLESVSGSGPLHGSPHWPRPDVRVVAPAALLLGGGALALGYANAFDWHRALLYLLGGALGLVLYHATFGFASSWRLLVAEGRGAGLRAQMLMLAVATAIFLPILAEGAVLGRPVVGAVAPFGVSVAVGAFLFGVGMQLGGACASGTLYTVGGGSTRMVVTLIFFVVGSLIGSAHLPWWLDLPNQVAGAVESDGLQALILATKRPIWLLERLGLGGALGLQLAVFALIAGVSVLVELRRRGYLEESQRLDPTLRPAGWRRLIQGPWPLLWGALLLALLNGATLAIAGNPWNVSFGYTLWGASAAQSLGLDVASWDFWTWRYPSKALEGGIFAETTSLMNLGIVAGAFLAAGLAGRFSPERRLALRPALAAVVGGLLMGYGARLAFGCNIGAYFSGIASGSLHGWLWFLAALAGTWVGLRLRPLFGLAIPRARQGGC